MLCLCVAVVQLHLPHTLYSLHIGQGFVDVDGNQIECENEKEFTKNNNITDR